MPYMRPRRWWAEYRTDWGGGWRWRVGWSSDEYLSVPKGETQWEYARTEREAKIAARDALAIFSIAK